LGCAPRNDLEPSSFSWYKVNPVDGAEEEVTNSVGSGFTVSGGELTIKVGNLENGDRYRCKLDEEVFMSSILFFYNSHFGYTYEDSEEGA